MRRQILNLLLLFGIIMASALVYRAVFYRSPDHSKKAIAAVNAAREAEVAALLENDARKWRSASQFHAQSEALTNAIVSLVNTEAPQFETFQRMRLRDVLTSWLYAASTGRYDDYLAFRGADYVRFEGNSLVFLEAKLKDKVPYLDDLADHRKCALLYEHFNNATLESVPDGSLSLNIFRAGTTPELINSKDERSRYVKEHYFGGWSSFESVSPFRYRITEEDVLEKHGAVDLAYFHVRLITRGERFVIPTHITFFWSPDERRWKPFEFKRGTGSPMAGRAYVPHFFF